MSRIVILDTETTGLDPQTCDIFEVCMWPLDTPSAVTYRIRPRPEAVTNMHPKAAEVNRFHERTASPDWEWDPIGFALDGIRLCLEGAHILGAVPDFDTRFLAVTYRRHGMEPPRWHYHLIDIEVAIIGYLLGRGERVPDLPWSSDDLSERIGIPNPHETDRHTALGDVLWIRAMWDRINN